MPCVTLCRVRRSQRPEFEIVDGSDDIALETTGSRRMGKDGRLGGIRTPNPQIRSLVLYPVELRDGHYQETTATAGG